MIKCPVCLQPKRSLDGHHIYPIAYGGPQDGPIFDLCASCHQDVHRQAEAYCRGDNSLKMLSANFQRAQSFELISTIMLANNNYSKGIVPKGGSIKNHEVIFVLTQRKRDLLHKAKIALNAGSIQVLMENAVDSIIQKTLGVDPNANDHIPAPRARRIKPHS